MRNNELESKQNSGHYILSSGLCGAPSLDNIVLKNLFVLVEMGNVMRTTIVMCMHIIVSCVAAV